MNYAFVLYGSNNKEYSAKFPLYKVEICVLWLKLQKLYIFEINLMECLLFHLKQHRVGCCVRRNSVYLYQKLYLPKPYYTK